MAYPFQREPEFSESEFSIIQHKAIEEIIALKQLNNREESIKTTLKWIVQTNAYQNLHNERSTLEGLSKLYYFIACDHQALNRPEQSLRYHEKSITAMEKCCAIQFSQLYTEELANGYFQYAKKLEELGHSNRALSEAIKCRQILDSLIQLSNNEFNIEIEENRSIVEEFINEMQNIDLITSANFEPEQNETIEKSERNLDLDAGYDEWRDSLGGKSLIEHLFDISLNQENRKKVHVINIMSLLWLRLENKIEVKLSKQRDMFIKLCHLNIS